MCRGSLERHCSTRVTMSISACRSRLQSMAVPVIICASTTPRRVAQMTSATPAFDGSSVMSRPSWPIAEFISSRWRREDAPGPPRVARRISKAAVDDGHQQAVAVAEVILDDPPRHARAFGHMLGGRGGESFLNDAADRLVDDLRPSVVAAFAGRVGAPGGADRAPGRLACDNAHC